MEWNLFDEMRTLVEANDLQSGQEEFSRLTSGALASGHNILLVKDADNSSLIQKLKEDITPIQTLNLDSSLVQLTEDLASNQGFVMEGSLKSAEQLSDESFDNAMEGISLRSLPYVITGFDHLFSDEFELDSTGEELIELIRVARNISNFVLIINSSTLEKMNETLRKLEQTKALDDTYSLKEKIQAHLSVFLWKRNIINVLNSGENFTYDFSRLEV